MSPSPLGLPVPPLPVQPMLENADAALDALTVALQEIQGRARPDSSRDDLRQLEGLALDALRRVDDVRAALQMQGSAVAHEELRHQSLHDALTGLPNRVLFQERLAQALQSQQRDGTTLALLLLDLDRFKIVNDTLGHQHGDILLQQVALRLRHALRGSDTVARLGGDEFALVLPEVDRAGATYVARRLYDLLDTPVVIGEHAVHVTASIGIALCPDHGSDAETLLRHADVAMYAAKRSSGTGRVEGHGEFMVYDPVRDEHGTDHLVLAEALRAAIAAGDLELDYQPIVEVASGRVLAVEALARWRHPHQGYVPLDRFIPLAEQTGLIVPMMRWVVGVALRECASWHEAGFPIGVSVNLSAVNLHDPDLVTTVADLLTHYGLPPGTLSVELTETSVMADLVSSAQVLERLHQAGVRVAIDDFGMGYTSLAYLKRLPVSQLKIDRSFVLHMGADDTDYAIIMAMVGLGHTLGMHVVAEGVEDGVTQGLLAALGCDALQGYHLGRPMPAPALRTWLLEHHRARR